MLLETTTNDFIFGVWPPPYQVRRSVKIRRATLKISPRSGLEVVLPMRFKESQISVLLAEKRAWIEKNLIIIKEFEARRDLQPLPDTIDLKACGEVWKVHYLPNQNLPRILVRLAHELVVFGNINNTGLCQLALKHWLRKKAHIVLGNHLQSLSSEYGFTFHQLTIRNQKSRWGSCSAQGNINLNFKLIFLNPEYMRHILLHELCHTKHLDHSAQFWKLLSKCDLNWQAHRRHLKSMDHLIPFWAD